MLLEDGASQSRGNRIAWIIGLILITALIVALVLL
jgi:hypothetical protein